MNLRGRVERLSRQRRGTTALEPWLVAEWPDGQWLALRHGAWVDWSAQQPLPAWCKVYRGLDPRLV